MSETPTHTNAPGLGAIVAVTIAIAIGASVLLMTLSQSREDRSLDAWRHSRGLPPMGAVANTTQGPAAGRSAIAERPPTTGPVIDFGSATAACSSLADSRAQGRLRELTDAELQRGLCLTSRAVVDAVSQRRGAAEAQCMAAIEALGREFKGRFPGSRMTPEALGC